MVITENKKNTVYFSDLLTLAYPRLWGRVCDAMEAYGYTPRKLKEVFDVHELTFTKDEKNNWAYVNLLRTKDFILVPGLGTDSDSEALKQIKQLYPNYAKHIQQVNIAPIVEKYGGAFNCLTWTVQL